MGHAITIKHVCVEVIWSYRSAVVEGTVLYTYCDQPS